MARLAPAFGTAELGVSTFFASSHPSEVCGSNGLPLTPNSIKILGRAQILKTFHHPHLCTYVDVMRGKHEQIKIVSEYYSLNLKAAVKLGKFSTVTEIVRLAFEIIDGAAFLNEHGLCCRNLSPESILLNRSGHAKIYNYGLYYMTGDGTEVTFPIGNPKYLAPEVYAEGKLGPSVDMWSLGLILMELLLNIEIWSDLKLGQIIRKVQSLIHSDTAILERIAQEHNCIEQLHSLPQSLLTFLRTCLSVTPKHRSCATELLRHSVFGEHGLVATKHCCCLKSSFPSFSTISICGDTMNVDKEIFKKEEPWLPEYPGNKACNLSMCDGLGDHADHLALRSMSEVYYLWKLAGGDVEAVLKKQGLVRYKPPILSMPTMVLLEGKAFGYKKDRALLLDQTVVVLSLNELRKRLSHIPLEDYYPLCELQYKQQIEKSTSTTEFTDTAVLPLIIREKDIEYQFHRVILYERLLKAYPYKRRAIWKEACQDIPPFHRGHIWSSLLEIEGDVQNTYKTVDKETPTPTDRQIEVDIPRCHQYDELLSSPVGHAKFKRVLKAWVVSNPQYVYWQGLDSLCAPFLYLNFNDEALAYACFSAFIPKYLHNFFLKDNSAVIQEYLAKFSHLIAFHDPGLTNHLDEIGFIPELYAIPWFLTMFSHVFPLQKIFHLWDKLILGDSSFPLCVGLAILLQLRDTLLASGFNECILLFSDMPEIDIERCVKDSVEIFCSTPKSCMYRQHALHSKKAKKQSNAVKKEKDIPKNKAALGMDEIIPSDLKAEKCPRISGQDLLELLDLQRTKYTKPKVLVVDVRNHDEYIRGTIPNAINIPFSTAFTPDGALNPSSDTPTLSNSRGKIITVIGGKSYNSAVKFSENLVRLDYPRVCVLHKGIDAFRLTDILQVPRA